MVIMIAVPPPFHEEMIRMSREGGIWDEMKRTITWSIEKLVPGETLELQIQFVTGGQRQPQAATTTTTLPTFPLLVRSEYPALFSAVEVVNEYYDTISPAIQLQTARAGRILHRKV